MGREGPQGQPTRGPEYKYDLGSGNVIFPSVNLRTSRLIRSQVTAGKIEKPVCHSTFFPCSYWSPLAPRKGVSTCLICLSVCQFVCEDISLISVYLSVSQECLSVSLFMWLWVRSLCLSVSQECLISSLSIGQLIVSVCSRYLPDSLSSRL